jgi:beta-phosphoglucomutase-like phosphatase (HAD superfamily)
MTKLQALLFDVDGTIADTEELHRQSFNHAFLRSNLKWTWSPAFYAELLGISGGHDRIAHYIDGLDEPAGEKARLRQLIPHIHQTKTYEFGMRLEEGSVQPRPGVVRLIEEAAAAGLKIGFASTSAWVNVSALLSATFGPSMRFEVGAIANADMVPKKKPDPAVYELLMRMLRVPAEACVAFEDSANGVAAARAAGVFVVATPSQWTAGQDFSQADLALPMLGDPDARLAAADAARIGGAPWLGLEELSLLRQGPDREAGALHVRTS